jgi:hypothetical protein
MGLDMYAKARPPGRVHEDEDIMYWRKHNALHGWMTDLALEKGIIKEPNDFNVVELQLTLEDLERLEKERFNMPPTQGFFFGNNHNYSYYEENDKEFIEMAKDYLERGYIVIYYSWW